MTGSGLPQMSLLCLTKGVPANPHPVLTCHTLSSRHHTWGLWQVQDGTGAAVLLSSKQLLWPQSCERTSVRFTFHFPKEPNHIGGGGTHHEQTVLWFLSACSVVPAEHRAVQHRWRTMDYCWPLNPLSVQPCHVCMCEVYNKYLHESVPVMSYRSVCMSAATCLMSTL